MNTEKAPSQEFLDEKFALYHLVSIVKYNEMAIRAARSLCATRSDYAEAEEALTEVLAALKVLQQAQHKAVIAQQP